MRGSVGAAPRGSGSLFGVLIVSQARAGLYKMDSQRPPFRPAPGAEDARRQGSPQAAAHWQTHCLDESAGQGPAGAARLPALRLGGSQLEVWRLPAPACAAVLRMVGAALQAAQRPEPALERDIVGGLCSVSTTREETSVVLCRGATLDALAAALVAERAAGWAGDVFVEREWACLMVEGPLAFGMVGVLYGLLGPLRAQGISVFAVSTYDTDYLLFKEANRALAARALVEAGYVVRGA